MISFLANKKKGDEFSREDYENSFAERISEKTARNDIAKMLDFDFIQRAGRGPSTKYIRTIKELPESAAPN